jgi:hypothetical protein
VELLRPVNLSFDLVACVLELNPLQRNVVYRFWETVKRSFCVPVLSWACAGFVRVG